MTKRPDRRTILKLMGSTAMAGAIPASITRALAAPANSRTGTIADVEHIVILTQENRSFDHYFGTMMGVRGFGDPRAITLRTGRPVWFQPDGAQYVLPFRPNVQNVAMMFLPDPPHDWNSGHRAWNNGEFDRWIPQKTATSMTYHRRDDLPYHFALADAFTICDAYHCSVMGPTDPNRYHMWTGWLGNDGQNGGPVITNDEAGYDWSTYPERLERAGISWKVYQDTGLGLDQPHFWGWTSDPYIGNYGDNSLLYFHQYQNAAPGTPLANGAKVGTTINPANRTRPERLFDNFRQDVESGNLPQISYIAAPEAYTEHPNWRPAYGAWYLSQIVDILASNPDVWSKTVFFVNFDEEGGFFDHQVPPTPPISPSHGASTVPITNELFAGDGGTHDPGPYGLGIRVPMIIVSPWTKGGWVNSEVFDHTSIIKFIEARFGAGHPDLIETNVTPWRRAVVGDLTSAFDFAKPEAWKKLALPSTAAFRPPDFVRHPDETPVVPANQTLPVQEVGVRPARALPYALEAHGTAQGGNTFHVEFTNTGEATAVFHVRSGDSTHPPRSYTVEPQKLLSGNWTSATGDYDLAVHGPNGFLRSFRGATTGFRRARLDVQASFDPQNKRVVLAITNVGTDGDTIHVRNAYADRTDSTPVNPGATMTLASSLTRFSGWYDFVITVEGDASFRYQLAGHLEDGNDSTSDPAMGGVALGG